MPDKNTAYVSPEIAGILSLFDPALDWSADLSGDEYATALKEYLVVNQEGSVDPRRDYELDGDTLAMIKEEFNKVRKNKDLEYSVKKKKISTSKFFGKEEKKTQADTTGTSSLVVRSKTGKIDTKKLIPEPTEEKGGALAEILTGVNSIVETLKATKKQDKKQQSWLQRMTERFKRRKKEDKLEFKVFDGLKKTATKLLAPMKNAWSEFLGFIGKVILGRVLFKI